MNWLMPIFESKRYMQKEKQGQVNQSGNRPVEVRLLHKDLALNIEETKRLFPASPDLVIHRFTTGSLKTPATLLYLDSLTDKNVVNNNILRPMMYGTPDVKHDLPAPTISGVKIVSTWGDVEDAILHGESTLFIDGKQQAWIYKTQGWPQRAIEEPQLESSLKGAHQGFLETGLQNIALIRRYIASNELKIAEHSIGRRGKSKVWIMYLEDVAHPEVLQELETRIEKIDVDVVINTGELAQYIEDNPHSPFPQLIMTERPDSAVSQLLQGRFVVIVDRSPSVIIAPASFVAFFQNVDDYSSRWQISSFIRLLRFAAFMIALLLPSLYISVISYNYEIIPLHLLLSIAESRAEVPFPPVLEAVLMEITLEMMREAGIRLPAPIGQTMGIVGGIVVGQTAVQTGIVSNIMVVVVATTAIASFIIPSYDMGTAVRLMRFPMMLMASLFGIIGVIIGFMTLVAHLSALESLGTPYGSPLTPFRLSDMKDTFIRLPLWNMINRPKSARPIQDKRLGKRSKGDDT